MLLRSLRIRDLVIVQELTLELAGGLNLLTGETGAGKSIVVAALGLASGQRGDRSLVRAGCERAVVEALFELAPDEPLAGWLAECGAEGIEQGELLIKRELPVAGAGRAWINGAPTPLGLLRELGSRAIELHGQHEQQSLLGAEGQLDLLDRFGGHAALLAEVARCCGRVARAAARVEDLAREEAEQGARAAAARDLVSELERLRPREGEISELDVERRVLRHAGRVTLLLDQIRERLAESEQSAGRQAAGAARAAEELAGLDPACGELAARLQGVALELQDLGASFEEFARRARHDPGRLEELETRRAALERACARHGTDEAGLVELGRRARESARSIEDREAAAAEAKAELVSARSEYAATAAELSAARRRAGTTLETAVGRQLPALALAGAGFEVRFLPRSGSAGESCSRSGEERVELFLSPNPGEPAAPLRQVASGGELSRVMLALRAAGGAGDGRILVFDEIDTGVGGAVADALGVRLAGLASRQQVLCVTHLPQIAAYADRHYRVDKRSAGGRTLAGVDALVGAERVEELARMLGGRRPTPAARRHAAEMIDAAARRQP